MDQLNSMRVCAWVASCRSKPMKAFLPCTSTPSPNRVNLIDEDDGRWFSTGGFEKFPDSRSAKSTNNFDEFGASHGEEGDIGFMCQSLYLASQQIMTKETLESRLYLCIENFTQFENDRSFWQREREQQKTIRQLKLVSEMLFLERLMNSRFFCWIENITHQRRSTVLLNGSS